MIQNTMKKKLLTFTVAGILAFSSLPVDAVLGDTTLEKGMRHDDIKVMQQLLKDKGYFHNSETTTYFGDETLKAVLEFQKSQDLKQDGIFGPTTYKALMGITGSSNTVENKAAATNALLYTRDLKLKSTGEDVKQLQEALKRLGFLSIANTTTYFGSQTEQALISFQKSYGIGADGIAGHRSIDKINEALAGKKSVAPSRGDTGRSQTINIISTAKKYLGVPYVFGGSTIKGFDCSGYTQFVFKQNGINIPRTTDDQAKIGAKISKANLQVGDLIIFSNTYKAGPSHAGIYLGDGKFIHASSAGEGVIISDLNSSYYNSHFSWGQRVY